MNSFACNSVLTTLPITMFHCTISNHDSNIFCSLFKTYGYFSHKNKNNLLYPRIITWLIYPYEFPVVSIFLYTPNLNSIFCVDIFVKNKIRNHTIVIRRIRAESINISSTRFQKLLFFRLSVQFYVDDDVVSTAMRSCWWLRWQCLSVHSESAFCSFVDV